MYIETLQLQKDEITIELRALHEDSSIEQHFDESMHNEVYKLIEQGHLWFTVELVIIVDGVELANEYIGGNLFESLEHWKNESCYFAEMYDTAMNEAKNKIRSIATKLLRGITP